MADWYSVGVGIDEILAQVRPQRFHDPAPPADEGKVSADRVLRLRQIVLERKGFTSRSLSLSRAIAAMSCFRDEGETVDSRSKPSLGSLIPMARWARLGGSRLVAPYDAKEGSIGADDAGGRPIRVPGVSARKANLRSDTLSYKAKRKQGILAMHDTLPLLRSSTFPPLRRRELATLQVNLGYRCNQSCVHCHVNAGPRRSEQMDDANIALIPKVLAARGLPVLDLTGGAPELHPRFRDLVEAACGLGAKVIDRCNLTILSEPGYEDLAEFLARQRVEVVASLPCYLEDNVDKQRGRGVYQRSIDGLERLNALGYGLPRSGLELHLVYNPAGANLPPDQGELESAYKRELVERHGIRFNRLYTLANMPIKRFGSTLVSKGGFADYMQLLEESFCTANLEQVMCRDLISVDWQGFLYDCDFNQQLGLELRTGGPSGARRHLSDLLEVDLAGAPISVAGHCYGCTAGQGSSCGGSLTPPVLPSPTSG
jgi:radical SAM/Cys-rich protein